MKTAAPFIEPLENRIAPAFAAVIELSALSGSDGFKLSGAASLAAGVLDPTADGFGQNDTRIAEILATPKIFAAIASITIKGSASGSAADGDFFGITAEKLGKLSITGLAVALTNTDTALDTDFHAVRFA